MSLIRPSLDYTSKDFDALRARLFNLVDSAFPAWTDKQVADFGNLLVELFAFVGDVLTFYQDNQAKESRWSAAQLRRSMIGLVKLINYTPSGASAATADLVVQLSSPPKGSVTFRRGDTFRTLDAANPVAFQVLENIIIPPGADPPVARFSVEHSEASEDVMQSSEMADQEFVLSGTPFLEGTLVVKTEVGAFALVRDFLSSTSTDRHMTVTVDENSKAHVRFGNGVNGAVPSGAIAFEYKTGGGARGNVDAGAIQRADFPYRDSLGNPVAITVTNPSKASGGHERQTVEAIREAAPRSLRAATRTVSREDYEIQALRVPGVARALMASRDEKPSVAENAGELYLVPASGGDPSDALLAAVHTMCTVTYPKTITFRLSVLPASYLVVNVTARVHLAKGFAPAVVGPALRARLAAFFAPTAANGSQNAAINFGFYLGAALAWSDVFDVVRDCPGVRKVDDGPGALLLNDLRSDVKLEPQQFPSLGTVTLVDAATGAALP